MQVWKKGDIRDQQTKRGRREKYQFNVRGESRKRVRRWKSSSNRRDKVRGRDGVKVATGVGGVCGSWGERMGREREGQRQKVMIRAMERGYF